MTLSEKIEVYLTQAILIQEIFRNRSIEIRNDSDGNGDYIAFWNYADKPEPTQEQLEAIE
tara:strand:- start:72 stop:251 length:180 start_codon:yes stop_codon:yes gene_type:complete